MTPVNDQKQVFERKKISKSKSKYAVTKTYTTHIAFEQTFNR